MDIQDLFMIAKNEAGRKEIDNMLLSLTKRSYIDQLVFLGMDHLMNELRNVYEKFTKTRDEVSKKHNIDKDVIDLYFSLDIENYSPLKKYNVIKTDLFLNTGKESLNGINLVQHYQNRDIETTFFIDSYKDLFPPTTRTFINKNFYNFIPPDFSILKISNDFENKTFIEQLPTTPIKAILHSHLKNFCNNNEEFEKFLSLCFFYKAVEKKYQSINDSYLHTFKSQILEKMENTYLQMFSLYHIKKSNNKELQKIHNTLLKNEIALLDFTKHFCKTVRHNKSLLFLLNFDNVEVLEMVNNTIFKVIEKNTPLIDFKNSSREFQKLYLKEFKINFFKDRTGMVLSNNLKKDLEFGQ